MRLHHTQRQQGATMMLTLVFMIGMLGMIGLTIDTGHVLVNKTRLQNALDAAALSAAIVLNGPTNNSTTEATTAGLVTFDKFIKSAGNVELTKMPLPTFLYSDSVTSFLPGNGIGPYVRVKSNALPVSKFFIQVLTGSSPVNVGAVSTAGPTGQNCNLVPLVICADIDSDGKMDKDCSDQDPTELGIKECYGYTMGEESELHTKFCAPNDTACQATSLEAGNFTLLRWEGSAGKNDIRSSLAGGDVDSCSVGVQLETDPGNAVGPVSKGINDRFAADTVNNTYDNLSHPTADTPAYDSYLSDQASSTNSGIKDNRVVAAPIGDCNGIQNGNTTFDFATDGSGNMAAMCILIRRPVRATGADNQPDYLKNSIYIEMMELCPAVGNTDPNNPIVYGPFKIVLFKSQNSGDS